MILSKALVERAIFDVVYYNSDVIDSYCSKEQETVFSIDTRTLQKGDFFVAFPGKHVDGHDFVAQAVDSGAGGLLVQNRECLYGIDSSWLKKHPVIIVPNVHQAFIDLAKAWRGELKMPIVGITGSVGKTTTKEMLRSILCTAKKDAYISFKNQNTDIGLSLNVLATPQKSEIAVYEMGINEKGEMDELVAIARPTIGVITSVVYSHTEGLGTLADVACEKRKLFSLFGPTEIGVIAGDQELLGGISYLHPVAKFGTKTKNQVQARKVQVVEDRNGNLVTHFILKWFNKKTDVTLHGNHPGYVNNALAASTVAYLLDVELDNVVTGLEQYSGLDGRFEMKQLSDGAGILIDDCYNANPESMKAALLAFNQIPSRGKKIAVLGDMLELGEMECYWHRQIGRQLAKSSSIDVVILVGKRSKDIASTAPSTLPVKHTNDWKEAISALKQYISKDSLILVKASFGVKLKNLVNVFVE